MNFYKNTKKIYILQVNDKLIYIIFEIIGMISYLC